MCSGIDISGIFRKSQEEIARDLPESGGIFVFLFNKRLKVGVGSNECGWREKLPNWFENLYTLLPKKNCMLTCVETKEGSWANAGV